jgi:hypothetical protein
MTTPSGKMGRAAGKLMPPTQMQAMMGQMMQTMFADMSIDDRIAFASAMLPQCIGAMFDNLAEPGRERLATTMADLMNSTIANRAPRAE